MWCLAATLAMAVAACGEVPAGEDPGVDLTERLKARGELVLSARSRQARVTSGETRITEQQLRWKASETAIIVCDMWDKHWCAGATRRVGIMVPRMNAVLDAARARGVFVVHAPSDVISAYDGTLPRRRMQAAAPAEPPVPIERWCRLDPATEGELPIDDSDGGCDCYPTCNTFTAWKGQHPGLDIAREDGVSDRGEEIYNYFRQQGITNVVLMGVHTNMCVLGRSFGIRQLKRLGFNVVLARDLTDTMYNPRSRPHVSHSRGTELVVEHVERQWCPSILSEDLTRVAAGSDGP